MSSLEKFKIKEKIKLCYLKYRGNVLKVAEATGYDVEYIRRQIRKLKKEEERDVSVMISNNLTQTILFGYQQRITYLQDMLDNMENLENFYSSDCCGVPVDNSGETPLCPKCNRECRKVIVDKAGIYTMKQKLIEMLRDEDTALVGFAEKMGYTNAPPPPPAVRQNILVMGGGKDAKLSEGEKNILTEVAQMRPHDREAIRKSIEHKIIKSAEGENKQSEKTK